MPTASVSSDCAATSSGRRCAATASSDSVATLISDDLRCDGMAEAAQTDPAGDCDDTDPGDRPGALDKRGDHVDQDRDGFDGRSRGCDSTGGRGPGLLGVLLGALLMVKRRRR